MGPSRSAWMCVEADPGEAQDAGEDLTQRRRPPSQGPHQLHADAWV